MNANSRSTIATGMERHAAASSRSFSDPVAQVIVRVILVAFVLTFIAARIIVFLIVSRRLPDIYLPLGGTHVHHLNYGILLLSLVGGYLLLVRPADRRLRKAAAVYGVGLGLTFDEFGLWVHLGGSYWQRASFDAVVVVGSLLMLIAAAPHLSQFKPHHWFTAVTLALATAVFGVMLVDSFKYADRLLLRVQVIEESHPPLR
jgi:hypothetical protein